MINLLESHPLFTFLAFWGIVILIYFIRLGFHNAEVTRFNQEYAYFDVWIDSLPVTFANYEMISLMLKDLHCPKSCKKHKKDLWVKLENRFYQVSPYHLESEDHSPEELFLPDLEYNQP